MGAETYLGAIERDGRALLAATRTDLTAPVDSCPGWSAYDLLEHMGRVHRWAAGHVHRRGRPPEGSSRNEPGPADPAEVTPWYESGLAGLLDVLHGDLDAPAWNWTGQDLRAGWWARRQAHETAVHRWDADGHSVEPPNLAADGIDEVLGLAPLGAFRRALDVPATVHLHCTDSDGEWVVALTADGIEIRNEHAKADAALRGGAADLLLVLWGRLPYDQLDVVGEPAVLDRWFAPAP